MAKLLTQAQALAFFHAARALANAGGGIGEITFCDVRVTAGENSVLVRNVKGRAKWEPYQTMREFAEAYGLV